MKVRRESFYVHDSLFPLPPYTNPAAAQPAKLVSKKSLNFFTGSTTGRAGKGIREAGRSPQGTCCEA